MTSSDINLVTLRKFKIITIIYFFRNGLFLQPIDTKIFAYPDSPRRVGRATDKYFPKPLEVKMSRKNR